MNLSGESVQEAAAFYKLPPEAIVAFHDELDLVPGKVRVKKGGGAAGHNGLRSMDRMLGTPRLLARSPRHRPPRHRRTACSATCSGNFGADDKPWLIALLDAVADSADLLAQGKHPDFMSSVALRTQEFR